MQPITMDEMVGQRCDDGIQVLTKASNLLFALDKTSGVLATQCLGKDDGMSRNLVKMREMLDHVNDLVVQARADFGSIVNMSDDRPRVPGTDVMDDLKAEA